MHCMTASPEDWLAELTARLDAWMRARSATSTVHGDVTARPSRTFGRPDLLESGFQRLSGTGS